MTPPARYAFTLVLAAVASVAAAAGEPTPPVLPSARQLVLVVTPDWNIVQGELRRFARGGTGEPWRPIGRPGPVVVGRNGMAWDPLAPLAVPGPQKAEGDGRSPAGAFPLSQAFGHAPAPEASWLKLPYLHLVEGIECVDDAASRAYNEIVDRRTIAKPDWTTSEKMREVGEAYRWGVVVAYNTPAVPGRGSCIFLHISGAAGRGTAGCTAMAPDVLRELMAWLDPAASPALVQVPRAAYDALRQPWRLP